MWLSVTVVVVVSFGAFPIHFHMVPVNAHIVPHTHTHKTDASTLHSNTIYDVFII